MRKSEHIPYPVNEHECWERPLEKGRISLHVQLMDHSGQGATVNLHVNQPHHEEAYDSVVATTGEELPLELAFLELAKANGLELRFRDLGWVTSYDPGYWAMLPFDGNWIADAKAFFADEANLRRIFEGRFKSVSAQFQCAGCHEPLEHLGGYGSLEETKEKACTASLAC